MINHKKSKTNTFPTPKQIFVYLSMHDIGTAKGDHGGQTLWARTRLKGVLFAGRLGPRLGRQLRVANFVNGIQSTATVHQQNS